MAFKDVESKVVAAGAGAGGGAVVSGFFIWFAGVLIWHAPDSAASAMTAASSVPSPVAALIAVALTIAGAVASGYAAPHTDRVTDSAASINTLTVSAVQAPPEDASSATAPTVPDHVSDPVDDDDIAEAQALADAQAAAAK